MLYIKADNVDWPFSMKQIFICFQLSAIFAIFVAKKNKSEQVTTMLLEFFFLALLAVTKSTV